MFKTKNKNYKKIFIKLFYYVSSSNNNFYFIHVLILKIILFCRKFSGDLNDAIKTYVALLTNKEL